MDGFVDRLHALRFLRACDPSYRALTFTLMGLLPTEHISLSLDIPSMLSPLPRQVRWNRFAHYGSIVVGLPQITVGSAPALSVSRPAQRSLALQPADSPSRLMRPSTPEAPTALLSPPPLRLLL